MINSDLVQRRLCKLGWTDRDFARKTGITYNWLMEIIWNMGTPCADITSHRIADALHVLHEDLTGGKPTPYVERYRNIRPIDAKALQRLLNAKGKGMSHKDLALRCRASQASISAIFTGRVHPSANLFLKIAWALDVPPERIMQAKRPAKKQAKDSLPPK